MTSPTALFDTLDNVVELYQERLQQGSNASIERWLSTTPHLPEFAVMDYQQVLLFLYSYRGSQDTFNAYRRELERLLQWSWWVKKQSLMSLQRLDIEAFIEFCADPPLTWIGSKTVQRFFLRDGVRVPNPEWRPFNVKVSKTQHTAGITRSTSSFSLSQTGLRSIFAVLGSFYDFLQQEDKVAVNPVSQIRQKSKFLQKQSHATPVRRLSPSQWNMVISVAEQLAADDSRHERTLFMLQALYGMYLRISELAATPRWTPMMRDFFRDVHGNWWFQTVGKGNKQRQVAVSDALLLALKRWRAHLELSPLPSPDEQNPLIPRQQGKGPISSTRAIRQIVQECFDVAVTRLRQQGDEEEANLLAAATVHWLRHTGISDDVQNRPREHVRDDAGHSTSAITDRYVDVELTERHASAKQKKLREKED